MMSLEQIVKVNSEAQAEHEAGEREAAEHLKAFSRLHLPAAKLPVLS